MTVQSMEIEEFLEVMAQNAEFYPEFDALSHEQKVMLANVNICTGEAESFYDEDGSLLAVAGIRYVGLAEPWMITIPQKRTPALLRKARKGLLKFVTDKNIWRMFASTRLSENFLDHLGFRKDETIYTWTRKEA